MTGSGLEEKQTENIFSKFLESVPKWNDFIELSFMSTEYKSRCKQIIALRFASDEELLTLIDRTLKENLAPKQIKEAIKNWIPDNKRV